MYEVKIDDVYKDFSKDFSNYSPKSKYYDDSNKLVVGKMKGETAGVVIKGLFGIKLKVYSFLVDDNSEHKKAKCVNKNIIEKNNSEQIQRCFVR